MKRLINYWREFFIDFSVWRKFRKVVRGDEEFLLNSGMRVDWLGRVYTIINMPEEVINNQEMVQQGWVLQQLKPFNEILMKVGVADYAFPEISKVPNANAYLIVMYPDIDALNPWRMLWNFTITGLIISAIVWSVGFLIDLDLVTYAKGLMNE